MTDLGLMLSLFVSGVSVGLAVAAWVLRAPAPESPALPVLPAPEPFPPGFWADCRAAEALFDRLRDWEAESHEREWLN